jgi:lipopolysaccharide/colanic/teichoic acid biosynthesis glycosyltransferase
MTAKRIFDLLFAIFGLIILAPLMLGIAIIIKICSRGPIFFRQKRIGRFGMPFTMYKFRTMVPGAEWLGEKITVGQDVRITPVGVFLRKYKFDELPQLFNVLKGEMSFVGPRPELEKYVQVYPEDFEEILKIRPGLSDLASIKYRDEASILTKKADPEEYYCNVILPDKLSLSKQYIKTISFKSDLSIIGNTLRSILKLSL